MEERELDEDLGLTIQIKKRKDGLNEVVDENAEENPAEEEGEDVLFSLPEEAGEEQEAEGEEFADLPPEQMAEYLQEREAAALKAKALADENLKKATECEESGDRESALSYYEAALDAEPTRLETNLRYAALRTENFTAYEDFDTLREVVEEGEENCGEKFRLAVKAKYADPIFKQIRLLADKADALSKELSAKKEERRKAFKRDYLFKRRAVVLSAIPLVLLAVLTVVFAFNIASVKDSTFLILTIAGAACTLVSFAVFLILGRKLSTAQNRLAANERDESTQLGRDFLEIKGRVSFLSQIVK